MALFTGLPLPNLPFRPLGPPLMRTLPEGPSREYVGFNQGKAAERQALLDDDLYQLARQQDLQASLAQVPEYVSSFSDEFVGPPTAADTAFSTQYGIDAPRTAATPSGAYTASELDAITQAGQRDALAQAKAEESKSFMEHLGLTQPTRDDLTPAFPGLNPGRYNINQYDPLGVKGYQIASSGPFQTASHAMSMAPGLGPFGAFAGITGAMAEARAVDRTREMYGLPTTGSFERGYQPTSRGGIGSFFGFGTAPLFDEAELAAPEFAGYLGDVGAETGARSRAEPDYSGTTGYAPGERAYDRYTYEYTQALDEYNKELGRLSAAPLDALGRPMSQAEIDQRMAALDKTHPAYRQQELEQIGAVERTGFWDPVTNPMMVDVYDQWGQKTGEESTAGMSFQGSTVDPYSGLPGYTLGIDLDAPGGHEDQARNEAIEEAYNREVAAMEKDYATYGFEDLTEDEDWGTHDYDVDTSEDWSSYWGW